MNGNRTPLKEALAFAETLAGEARSLALRWFRTHVPTEAKADRTPVTQADREIESLLRLRLRTRFPEHGILGEEEGAEEIDRPDLWVIDPIDGTKAFVTGLPLFGTLIGLCEDGVPVGGVVEVPAFGERLSGSRLFGTRVNGRFCRARETTRRLSDASVYTTSPDMLAGCRGLEETLTRAVDIRRFGADCYAYALVAMGWADAVIERDLKPWDFVALVPVLEGAGAVITDWTGRPLTLTSEGDVVAAANPHLHAELIRFLAPWAH
jgi:histidinol phosphatase-like enzyme (inositol monophosphatase family)